LFIFENECFESFRLRCDSFKNTRHNCESSIAMLSPVAQQFAKLALLPMDCVDDGETACQSLCSIYLCRFGFVEVSSANEAAEAFDCMKGQEIDGRPVTLDFASPSGLGGGGGGGGFGG